MGARLPSVPRLGRLRLVHMLEVRRSAAHTNVPANAFSNVGLMSK